MLAHDPLTTAFLLVETVKGGEPVWAVKWRSADGVRLDRRLGCEAWVVRDGGGRWRPREGRPTAGQLTEFRHAAASSPFIEAEEASRAEARALAADEAREEVAGGPTFRQLAHAWLEHLELVQSAKPSTLRDYRSMLAEPGTPYRRGRGKTVGRIMSSLGDRLAAAVTTADVEALLAAHAREGVGARSVNKHRQILSAIFNVVLRPEQATRWRLSTNPGCCHTEAPRGRPAPARGLHRRADRATGSCRGGRLLAPT